MKAVKPSKPKPMADSSKELQSRPDTSSSNLPYGGLHALLKIKRESVQRLSPPLRDSFTTPPSHRWRTNSLRGLSNVVASVRSRMRKHRPPNSVSRKSDISPGLLL